MSVVHYTGSSIDKGFYIVNGQHRHNECRLQNLAFNYLVIKSTDSLQELEDLIVVLNSDSKDWSPEQIVKSFCDRKYPEYLTIQTICKEYGVTSTIAVKLLLNNISIHVRNTIKYGKFEATHLVLTREILEEIKKFRAVRNVSMRQVMGFSKFYKGATKYNSEKFIKVLSLSKKRKLSESGDCQKFFEQIHKKSLNI